MIALSFFDRLIFMATNVAVYLRYPLFTLYFRRKQHCWPNFARPRDLAELVQWQKLFDRNPHFPIFADKLAAKAWTTGRAPDLAIPETVWVGLQPEEMPDEFLAPGFVIKSNNSSSQNYFPHRSGTDRGLFNRTVHRWLVGPLRARWRRLRRPWLEWAYVPVKPALFVERLVVGEPLVDFSIRATDGHAFMISGATDYKTAEARIGFFWPDGIRIDAPHENSHALLSPDFKLPSSFRDAVAHAQQLSRGFDYLRVDFLAAADQLYLSEITVYPASGYGEQTWRTEIVYRFWLEHLHKSWPLTTPQPWPQALYLRSLRRWLHLRKAELGTASDFALAHGFATASS